MASAKNKSIESAEDYVGNLGSIGEQFLKDTRRSHNRSIRGFGLPFGTATKAATEREKRIKMFAKANGWKPPKEEDPNLY